MSPTTETQLPTLILTLSTNLTSSFLRLRNSQRFAFACVLLLPVFLKAVSGTSEC